MNSYNISAVLAVNSKADLLQKFYQNFRTYHPGVPLVVSALQADPDVVEYLESIRNTDPDLKIVLGCPEDGHRVSFSENYNAAINAVETDKLVLVHTDMFFGPKFFEILDSQITGSDFVIYTTMEPPIYIGHRRPGKIIGDFGTSFDNFDVAGFRTYCESRPDKPLRDYGYGFFLAGPKSSFWDVGGFDQFTFVPVFCEDDDFVVRLRLKGYHAYLSENAVCYHFVSQTVRDRAGDPMADREFQANQAFCRKWGFEARYLWETGYETCPGALQITDRFIALEALDNSADAYMFEPIFNVVRGRDIQVANVASHKLQTPGHDRTEDITIKQLAPFSPEIATELLYKVGGLRLYPGNFKTGVFRSNTGEYQIEIHNPGYRTFLRDQNNYLSLQKEIRYT